MSNAPGHLHAARPVPGWPRRWFVLFGLHDYLLGDAVTLCSLWLRNRRAFWQYVMEIEEARAASMKGTAGGGEQAVRGPKPGAWRIG